MEDQVLYEYIEQYLKGELSEEEVIAFEHRMQEDSAFLKEVTLVKSLHQIVISGQEQKVLNQLNQIQADLDGQANRLSPKFPWKSLALVASILLLLVLGWMLDGVFSSADQEELFAEHFEPYRTPVVLRGEDIANPWEEIRDAYVEERFEEVIVLLENDSSLSPSYLRAFYLGQAYMANHPPKPDSAILWFQLVLQEDNDYQAQTYWYLALAHLQKGDLNQCKATLDILIRDYSYHKAEALRLRDRL